MTEDDLMPSVSSDRRESHKRSDRFALPGWIIVGIGVVLLAIGLFSRVDPVNTGAIAVLSIGLVLVFAGEWIYMKVFHR